MATNKEKLEQWLLIKSLLDLKAYEKLEEIATKMIKENGGDV